MYNTFFGFKEKPFKLVPNPDYLYLSKSHEIALAHLTYATDQGDGFVVITGEVGTGKTTMCRIFLERLDDKTDSAYIFNPKLDSIELLGGICNEFGIKTNLKTVKELLDVINGYLIHKNKAGGKVLLLIDEAQNLTLESLEMVRMLSNLETTRNKLLQIILVGQPELNDKLDSHELRQLSQRISLSCHLIPLSSKETEGYIRHRTNIAAQRDVDLFTKQACKKIHEYSGGIPRLINIACDRALLSAFSLNRQKVSRGVAQCAIHELSSRGHLKSQSFVYNKRLVLWLGVTAAGLVIFAALFWGMLTILKRRPPEVGRADSKAVETNTAPDMLSTIINGAKALYPVPKVSMAENAISDEQDPLQDPMTSNLFGPTLSQNETRLSSVIARLDPEKSRQDAVSVLLSLWRQPKPGNKHMPNMDEDEKFFDVTARQYGLRLYTIEQPDWDLIKKLNKPVLIALRQYNQSRFVYLTLVGLYASTAVVSDGTQDGFFETHVDDLGLWMPGRAYLVWKNTIGYDAIISRGAQSDAILNVKSLLNKIGYDKVDQGPAFDENTQWAITDFQTRHNLDPDGLVGPLTKILLINEAGVYEVPRLDQKKESSGA